MAIEEQPSLSPHLCVDGAAAARDFYVKAFNAVELAGVRGPDGRLLEPRLLDLTGPAVLAVGLDQVLPPVTYGFATDDAFCSFSDIVDWHSTRVSGTTRLIRQETAATRCNRLCGRVWLRML